MKKKLLLILFTFALSLGIFGASFSLDSFAESIPAPAPSVSPIYTPYVNYTIGHYGSTDITVFPTRPLYSIFAVRTPSSYGYYYSVYGVIYSGGFYSNIALSGNFDFSPSNYSGITFVDSVKVYDSVIDGLNSLISAYDENIIIKNYNAYWLGGINSIVPVLHGAVSDNVDHIDIELYWDDLDSTAIATYSVSPVLGRFFSFGSAVPFIGMQAHKMIYKIVPYSVTGNYGATYYSTVSSFNLNNTRYVDVPKASGNGTGRLDFNSYTQSVNSYSPTNNINQSTVLDTYYNRTYNNDYSTSEEFYNEYDYSTVDKSYLSNNQLTFNTNIEINFPQLDGDWLKNLFQTFSFNLPTDLMNHWIPGVPNWVIDIILAGIAIIVAAVIAKLLFTIL